MKSAPTPETDALRDEIWDLPYRRRNGFSNMLDHAKKLERERDAWKAKFIQQNKDLGCEMMDPNGTIWDYAKKLQKDLDTAIAERDALAKALEECKEDSIKLLGGRSWWKDEPRFNYKKRYNETRNNITRADAALAAVKPTVKHIDSHE
jgi:hypothetical protein